MAHELIHAFGFVYINNSTGCHPPHADGTTHVSGPSNDLMAPGEAGKPGDLVLDGGHDDYYGENVPAGCPNLMSNLVSGTYLS